MSEPPASPERAPEGVSGPPAAARRAVRARVVVLVLAAGLAVALAVVFALRARPARRPGVSGPASGSAAVRAPERPRLAGDAAGPRLAGVIVDGAGEPVAGAAISVELEPLPAGRAVGPEPPAPPGGGSGTGSGTRAAGPAERATLDAGGPRGEGAEPVTGADGRFAIDGLVPGRYRVRVSGAGLLDAELRMVAVPSDEVRIVVARRVSIEGRVTDGGQPVPAAMVGIRGEDIGGTLELKADTTGRFVAADLPEGRYQVYAYRGALAARTVRVARLGPGPFAPVELRVEAAAIVVGRVVDRGEGTGVIAAVELRPLGDDQAARYARTGDDGVFRFEGVPNGRWLADAFAPGYLSPGGVELEAGRGILELALTPGGAIEGRVLDADGKPVEGASVRAVMAGERGVETSARSDRDQLRRFSGLTSAASGGVAASSFADDPSFVPRGELGVLLGPIPPIPPAGAIAARPAAVVDPSVAGSALLGEPAPLQVDPARAPIWITGPDGRFRVAGLPGGKHAIVADAVGFAASRAQEVAIAPGQLVTGVDVVLSAGMFVVGTVTDARGAPVAGARVSAVLELGTTLETFSDPSGGYRIGPLVGKARLMASAYGHVETRRPIEVAVARGRTPGELRENIVLAVADAVLAGTLDDATGAAVGGARIELIGGAGQGRSVVVGADGVFALDGLPAGATRLRVSHPAYPTTELDAEATSSGRRVRLRVPLGGQAEGVLLDGTSGSPLPGTSFDARGPGGATAEATTDDKGLWKLGPVRPGRWRLELRLPGYLATVRELDVPVSHAPGETSLRDVRIELARGGVLGGTVRDRRGNRVAGARISIRRLDGTGAAVEADSDAQGEFRVRDCPTGELVVSARKDDATGSARAYVRPGDESLGVAVELR